MSYLSSLGNTPLTHLKRLSEIAGAQVYVKQERCNPSGSIKDRVAWYMIKDAVDKGILKPGSADVTVIEPTSGNTGIGLAAVGAALGIPVCIVMPDTMSVERRKLMSVYGAKLILTPGARGMKGAIEETQKIMALAPDRYFMPMQFENPANAQAHYETTGPEIEKFIGQHVDFIVAGVGTGGTLTGTARYFKPFNPELRVVAVEPATSPVIAQAISGAPIMPGPHGIQGIGAGFIPGVLDLGLITDTVGIDTHDAMQCARELLVNDAISTGISGGANIAAVLELAARGVLRHEHKVVTFIPDGIEKYLSTALCPET